MTVAGVDLKPALALGCWVAFKRMNSSGSEAIAMGDLVLTETEVRRCARAPGRRRRADGAPQPPAARVAARHLRARRRRTATRPSSPRRSGRARATQTPPAAPPAPVRRRSLSTRRRRARARRRRQRERRRVSGERAARASRSATDGMEIPPPMGVATAINFQPTGDGQGGDHGRLRPDRRARSTR